MKSGSYYLTGLCLIIWTSSCILVTAVDQTIHECLNSNLTAFSYNLTNISEIYHPVNPDIRYILYNSDRDLTWCESYHVCDRRGETLAVLDTSELQTNISRLNITQQAWIAGHRKDYGANVTWVNDTLTDCVGHVACDFNDDKDCGDVRFNDKTLEEFDSSRCTARYYSMCESTPHKLIVEPTSWNESQNDCVSRNSRLITQTEITVDDDQSFNIFIGLMRRPWIWIWPNNVFRPVYHSSWRSGTPWHNNTAAQCLTVDTDGAWIATPCAQNNIKHVICKRNDRMTTDAEKSTSSSPKTAGIIAGCVVGGIVLIAVIIVIVIVLRRKKGGKKAVPTDTPPEEHHYMDDNSVAYKTNDPVEYAEPDLKRGISLNPGRGYVLATAPGGPPSDDPAYAVATAPGYHDTPEVYNQVRKEPSIGTTLVENSNYGDFDAPQKPTPKPKPKPPPGPKPTPTGPNPKPKPPRVQNQSS